MHSNLNLSLLQHQPTPGSLETSLARLEEYARKATVLDSDLLLVPEASMTGYNIAQSLRDTVAEPIDGKLSNAVAELCRKYEIAISYGYIERCDDQYFNSVQVISKAGEPLCHYRKTHLWGDLDRSLFSAGECFSPIIEINGWKIGLLICYDIEFPETVRHLALLGAELVLVSTALMSPWSYVADRLVPMRAYENQIYIAYANYCGDENGIEYVGHSCIAEPGGGVLAKAGSAPIMLTTSLTSERISAARSALPYHLDRRPELYAQLSKHN